jgi:hypothetical protein
VCGLAAEKKHQILTIWTLLQDLFKQCQEQQVWLDSQEQILKDTDSRREQKSQDEIQDLISTVEVRIHGFVFFQMSI